MFHRLLNALRRRLIPPAPGGLPLAGGFPDIDWSMRVENNVVLDARRLAEAVTRSYPFGVGLQPADVLFDRTRGSLRLRPAGRPEIVLAVDDAAAAENIAAAFGLGGLTISISRAGFGLVLVEGVWDGRSYRLCGIPAVGVSV